MGDFFHVQNRKDLGGVLFTRIFDPAAISSGKVVYLTADPAGTWQPLPAACKKIDATGITNKLAVLVPYAAAPAVTA